MAGGFILFNPVIPDQQASSLNLAILTLGVLYYILLNVYTGCYGGSQDLIEQR